MSRARGSYAGAGRHTSVTRELPMEAPLQALGLESENMHRPIVTKKMQGYVVSEMHEQMYRCRKYKAESIMHKQMYRCRKCKAESIMYE